MRTTKALSIVSLLLSLFCPIAAKAQQGSNGNDWTSYGGDSGHSKYSPLDQINAENVQRLQVAWTWESVDQEIRNSNAVIRERGSFRSYAYEVTPLMVGGVIYTTTSLGQIAAIDPTSGETLWSFDPVLYVDGRPAVHGFMTRGLAYWTDGEQERLLYAGGRTYLLSIDPATGRLDPEFGRGGRVDLKRGLGRTIDPSLYAVSSPPIVVGDVIIVGSAMTEGTDFREAPPGHVRGFNVHTGEMQWIFHTIPQPGEFGADTWPEDAWSFTGGANVWTMMSADEELGLVYLPIGTTVPDYYGGHRQGDNLFSNSLVALNAETGERAWHYQMVHHSVWDYDPPAAPNLIDIVVDGQTIKAVAQITKQGFTFVFDRITGEPVWPIEERPVPQGDVPGEWYSPTQPFPTKPAAFDLQGITIDDLIDFTPELREEAIRIAGRAQLGPIFTPPPVRGAGRPIIQSPGPGGGINWPGTAVDPETGQLFIPSQTRLRAVELIEYPPPATVGYFTDPWASPVPGPSGLPLVKPPYKRITAIDLNTGDHSWMQPHGDGPRNHPAIRHLNLPALGGHGGMHGGGPLVTKTLLVVNSGGRYVEDQIASASTITAYHKDNGEYLGSITLPAIPYGNPITYLHEGKQYIAVAVGSGNSDEVKPELIALALP